MRYTSPQLLTTYPAIARIQSLGSFKSIQAVDNGAPGLNSNTAYEADE